MSSDSFKFLQNNHSHNGLPSCSVGGGFHIRKSQKRAVRRAKKTGKPFNPYFKVDGQWKAGS